MCNAHVDIVEYGHEQDDNTGDKEKYDHAEAVLVDFCRTGRRFCVEVKLIVWHELYFLEYSSVIDPPAIFQIGENVVCLRIQVGAFCGAEEYKCADGIAHHTICQADCCVQSADVFVRDNSFCRFFEQRVFDVFHNTGYGELLVAVSFRIRHVQFQYFSQGRFIAEQTIGARTAENDAMVVYQYLCRIPFCQLITEELKKVLADNECLNLGRVFIDAGLYSEISGVSTPVFYFRITALQLFSQQIMSGCCIFACKYTDTVGIF